MIIPVSCFTCGKIVGRYWDRYEAFMKCNPTPQQLAAELLNMGITRPCCSRMLKSHVNLIDILLLYDNPLAKRTAAPPPSSIDIPDLCVETEEYQEESEQSESENLSEISTDEDEIEGEEISSDED